MKDYYKTEKIKHGAALRQRDKFLVDLLNLSFDKLTKEFNVQVRKINFNVPL